MDYNPQGRKESDTTEHTHMLSLRISTTQHLP